MLDGNLSRGQINLYYAVLDSATGLLSTYPPDSDLTGELRCPAFELLGAGRKFTLQQPLYLSFYLVFCSYFHARKEKRNCC